MKNMNNLIYELFYGQSLHYISLLMLILTFIWGVLSYLFQRKLHKKFIWKLGNGGLCLGMTGIIVLMTISSRESGNSALILMPFHSFIEAQTQPEIYRSMLMNVFLFFPLGLTLPYTLPEKWKHKILYAILFALVFSTTIEFLQYSYHLGRAETDDVLCNTLGCAIGTLSYTLERRIFNKCSNTKNYSSKPSKLP